MKISDTGVDLAINCTGSGLIDKKVVEFLRTIDDPKPYYRGLVCEAGFNRAYVPFVQPARKRGKSYNNFFTLYNLAMRALTKFSKFPLKVMSLLGFFMSLTTFLLSLVYFVLKLLYWEQFALGITPIILSILFLGSVQLFCLGILGEYISAIYSRVDKKPLVIVKEKINF